jgi:hypothetical protein
MPISGAKPPTVREKTSATFKADISKSMRNTANASISEL